MAAPRRHFSGLPVAYLTAHMALSLAGFQAGKTVLAPAIGGSVGNAVTQPAKALGARHAISTTTSHAKAEQARTLFDDRGRPLRRRHLNRHVGVGGKKRSQHCGAGASGASLTILTYLAFVRLLILD